MDTTKTQRLANPNWRPSAVSARGMCDAFRALGGAPLAAPARRVPPANTTFSSARTQELPVIGRAGTRERVRAADAVFGGGEVR